MGQEGLGYYEDRAPTTRLPTEEEGGEEARGDGAFAGFQPLHHAPWTLNPEPYTINPEPSTLIPKP